MKKEYKKPETEVMEMEALQIICASPGEEARYNLRKSDGEEWEEYGGEFD